MRGSDEAFDRAFAELFRAAREIAYRILGDPHAADNVAAEATAGAFARWRRLRSPVNATGWVVRRAADIAIDAAPAPGTLEPEVLNEALGPALAALPRHQALAVALRYLSTLGPAQAATALRRSRPQVDADVAAALPRLARQLGPLADELPATTPMEAIPSRSDTTKVLHRVHARGLYLRRQPVTFALFLTLAAMLAASVAALVGRGGEHGSQLRVVAATSTTATTRPTSTSVPDTTAVPQDSTTVTAAAADTTVAGRTSTTTKATPTTVCRNSTDPSCGAFRWDPSPAPNQPMTLRVSYSPDRPSPSDVVMFTVSASDPDASIRDSSCRDLNIFGDESGASVPGGCSPCPASGRHGPWTPPPQSQGTRVDYVKHQYPYSGTYTATFRRASGDPCPDQTDPYASEKTVSVQVIVYTPPGP
jgi:DNA-directed RNA polymerase specialized sigma24 family protein